MLRYREIRQFLPKLNIDEIDDLELTKNRNKEADSLLARLEEMESVPKALQYDTTTLSDTCALFDTVIRDQPVTAQSLNAEADIVEPLNFESDIRKIQTGQWNSLTDTEKGLVTGLVCARTEQISKLAENSIMRSEH